MDYHRKELRKIKNQIRDIIDPYFLEEGYCKFCWQKSSFKMTVHHRNYIKDDVIYKNYPDNIEGRIDYYNDLIPLVRADPSRFLYICISCHNILEYYLQFGNELEYEIIQELSKKWSKFQFKFANRYSLIAKFALCELGLDIDGELQRKIDERPKQNDKPNDLKLKHSGLDDFFWS